jgi:hypothetical protein
MSEGRIALGLTLGREIDTMIALRWLDLLRSHYWPGPIYAARRAYTVQARNIVIGDAMAEAGAWDALLFWDSDQLPPKMVPAYGEWEGGFLTAYLSWLCDTYPVVGGLYYSREQRSDPAHGVFPFEPVAYERVEQGEGRAAGYRPLPPELLVPMLRERGVYRVGGVGTGSMLIRQDVLQRLAALKGPASIVSAPPVPEGATDRDGRPIPGWQWTEDLWLCEEIRTLLEEEIYLDTAAESAHQGDNVWISSEHYLAVRGLLPGQQAPAQPQRQGALIYGPDGAPLN